MDELAIADWIANQAKKDPKIRKIIADAHLFDSLRENTGWQRLYEVISSRKEGFLHSIAERMMRGEKIAPEEIEYTRGFYMGAVWVISHPEMAEKNLEKAARWAYTLASEQGLLDEEEVP